MQERTQRRKRRRTTYDAATTHNACGPRNEMLGWKRELLALDQRQLRPPARELRHRQLGLELAEGRAQAEVDAAAEGEVAAGVVAVEVEGSGSGKTDGSRPAAASHRKSFAPAGRSTPPTVAGRVVTRRQTQTEGSKRSVSSTAPGIGARVGDDALPARAVLEQAPHDVADQVVRRLVAGEAQREADRGDLVERERLGVLVVDVDQRAREVAGAARDALVDQPAQVAAVGDDVLGVRDLLLGRRTPEGQPGAVAAPALELRVVLGRHADEAEDDRRRQREGQRGDEVEGLGRVDRVEQVAHRRADRVLHRGHAPRREGARGVAAHARVLGRVEADHRRRRAVAAAQQQLARLLAQRGERQLRGGRPRTSRGRGRSPRCPRSA